MHEEKDSAVSKALLEKLKIIDHKYRFWILQISAFLENIGHATKQPLSNIEPQKPWKYKQLSGLTLDSSCLSKK